MGKRDLIRKHLPSPNQPYEKSQPGEGIDWKGGEALQPHQTAGGGPEVELGSADLLPAPGAEELG